MDGTKKPLKIGYVRVSTDDQRIFRQLDGLELDKTFSDIKSGKNLNRQGLTDLLEFVQPGDTVFVHALDRLARNLKDLRNLIDNLNNRGVRIHFVKENLIFSGKESAISNLILNVMGAVAEFERSINMERIMEGIAIAKRKGLYKGRKRLIAKDSTKPIIDRIKTGESISSISRDLKISRATINRYKREHYDKIREFVELI